MILNLPFSMAATISSTILICLMVAYPMDNNPGNFTITNGCSISLSINAKIS